MTPAGGLPGPREWLGGPPAWPAPADLEPGTSLRACYAILGVHATSGPEGSAWIALELGEARGRARGVLPAAEAPDWTREGIYVGVSGRVEGQNSQRRIRIEEIVPLHVTLDDLELFLPSSTRDRAELERELDALIASVRADDYRTLLTTLLAGDSDTGRGFRLAPAASRNHHAWLGGLLEHTVSVARLCDAAAAHYGRLDRDLLVTAALLHDIGKMREIGAEPGFPYTDEGRLLGHILLGLQLVGDAAAKLGLEPHRRLLLEHLIASHQGRYEWQSPREPRTLEALVLHYLDDLDAKTNHAMRLLDAVEIGWTEYDRSLGRELLRHSPRQAEKTEEAQRKPKGRTSGRKAGGRKASGTQRGKAAKKKQSAKRGKAARQKEAKRSPGARRARPENAAPPDRPPTGFIDRDTLDLFA